MAAKRKRKPVSAKKPFKPRMERRIRTDEVIFQAGTTKNLTSGGNRLYWHIRVADSEVGHAYIDVIPDLSGDEYASITVMLNAKSRGLGIGTIAFRRIAELSGCHRVDATIAKQNVASHIAAQRAGYRLVHEQPNGQLALMWEK
jgi:RimJ/RimL family protein N-acetyltransferase